MDFGLTGTVSMNMLAFVVISLSAISIGLLVWIYSLIKDRNKWQDYAGELQNKVEEKDAEISRLNAVKTSYFEAIDRRTEELGQRAKHIARLARQLAKRKALCKRYREALKKARGVLKTLS